MKDKINFSGGGAKSLILLLCGFLSSFTTSFVVFRHSNFQATHKNLKLQFEMGDEISQATIMTIIQQELGEENKISETSLRKGLSREEAEQNLLAYGGNVLPAPRRRSAWELWLDQFDDRLVQILVVVAAISSLSSFSEVLDSLKSDDGIALQSFVEPLVIISILVINAGVGVWQQLSAIMSLDALKKLQPQLATVLRRDETGQSECIVDFDASMIVPGDIIRIKVGDIVPADACIAGLMSSSVLALDESSLSGESVPVQKAPILEVTENIKIGTSHDHEETISMQKGMLFSGTTVTKGTAEAIVVKTGQKTKMGQLQSSISNVEIEKTPLNRQLDDFGDKLALIIAGICAVVWLVSIPRFDDPFFPTTFAGALYYAKVSVALGVAAIPEGLPAVITLVLALGTRRLAEQNVIVRNLESVETLGCVSIIATDKTGTLTTNQMTVVSLVMFEKVENDFTIVEHFVKGTSYEPVGKIFGVEKEETQKLPNGAVSDIVAVSFGCNDAELVDTEDGCSIIGDPTEGALLTFAEKLGVEQAGLDSQVDRNRRAWINQWDRYVTLDFDRKRKSMSTLCRQRRSGVERLLVKGAPDLLLKRCSRFKDRNGTISELTLEMRRDFERMISSLGSRPLRCLLLAIKEVTRGQYDDELKDADNFASIESDLTLIALVGIKDPARDDALESINLCKQAGIRVMMITGDAKDTAIAIAKELDILSDDLSEESQVFEGKEFFNSKSEEEQRALLSTGNLVLARTEATDKQLILKMLQSLGEIPAMTGDGVNDAPALRQANIGVAMGSGTEIAKEAADMVLVDDSFGTIVRGIQEGRCIYANIQAFINFLISCNIGEVFAVFLATLFGFPSILSAIQLLWVNLITDGPPAIALGWNPPDETAMQKPPRTRNEDIVTAWVLTRYLVIGLYIGTATVGIFTAHFLSSGIDFDLLSKWTECREYASSTSICDAFSQDALAVPQTLALTTLIVTEMLKALSSVSVDASLLTIGPQRNPALLVGVFIPFSIHLGILYSSNFGFPAIADSFGLVPLSVDQWKSVLLWSLPILPLEEILKAFSRKQLSP